MVPIPAIIAQENQLEQLKQAILTAADNVVVALTSQDETQTVSTGQANMLLKTTRVARRGSEIIGGLFLLPGLHRYNKSFHTVKVVKNGGEQTDFTELPNPRPFHPSVANWTKALRLNFPIQPLDYIEVEWKQLILPRPPIVQVCHVVDSAPNFGGRWGKDYLPINGCFWAPEPNPDYLIELWRKSTTHGGKRGKGMRTHLGKNYVLIKRLLYEDSAVDLTAFAKGRTRSFKFSLYDIETGARSELTNETFVVSEGRKVYVK